MIAPKPTLIQTALRHFERGEHENAKRLLLQSLSFQPRDFDALHILGVVHAMQGQTQQAIELFKKAIAVKRNNNFVHFNLARALMEMGRHEEALPHHRKATELAPNHAEAWLHYGKSLMDLDRLDDAIASFDRALHIQPDYAIAFNNKGLALADLGRTPEAIACFEQTVAHQPDLPDGHWNLALQKLRLGKYSEAWNDFEYRWQMEDYAAPTFASRNPIWTKQPSTRPLLLWGEQGIGDQILYASILPELTELPQKKYVALDKRLLALFERSMAGFEFVDLATVSDALGFAEQLPLGSLPGLFRPDLASFAQAHHPYLQADAARSALLRAKIQHPGKLVCGISWSSSRKSIGHHKSISLEQMLPPLASPHLHFVDLQYGDTAAERQALQQAHGIEVQHLDEVDNFHDIDGLAALIQACDVVITTSNSTAHLAGALGKPTLLLLPSGKGQLWYWAEINGTIPWYPSIRAFRQQEVGNWLKPLQEIMAALETR